MPRKVRRRSSPPKVVFNHALIYVRDVDRSLRFYRDRLGFRLIEEYRFKGVPGYARLRSSAGQTTLGLHRLERGMRVPKRGCLRLYFEVRSLESFCRALSAAGVKFLRKPKRMPWGWTHAYLRDPDGHEISLYRAGQLRLRAARLRASRK